MPKYHSKLIWTTIFKFICYCYSVAAYGSFSPTNEYRNCSQLAIEHGVEYSSLNESEPSSMGTFLKHYLGQWYGKSLFFNQKFELENIIEYSKVVSIDNDGILKFERKLRTPSRERKVEIICGFLQKGNQILFLEEVENQTAEYGMKTKLLNKVVNFEADSYGSKQDSDATSFIEIGAFFSNYSELLSVAISRGKIKSTENAMLSYESRNIANLYDDNKLKAFQQNLAGMDSISGEWDVTATPFSESGKKLNEHYPTMSDYRKDGFWYHHFVNKKYQYESLHQAPIRMNEEMQALKIFEDTPGIIINSQKFGVQSFSSHLLLSFESTLNSKITGKSILFRIGPFRRIQYTRVIGAEDSIVSMNLLLGKLKK